MGKLLFLADYTKSPPPSLTDLSEFYLKFWTCQGSPASEFMVAIPLKILSVAFSSVRYAQAAASLNARVLSSGLSTRLKTPPN